VSTPHNAHTEPVLAALGHGLHVLVDKPLALSSQDAWSMVRAAERADKDLMGGHSLRTLGLWRTAKNLLANGGLGHLRQITLASSVFRRWIWQPESPIAAEAVAWAVGAIGMPAEFLGDWQHWHADPAEMGGGAFSDTGSHWVDLLL
jgi:predicted dehydrogenase